MIAVWWWNISFGPAEVKIRSCDYATRSNIMLTPGSATALVSGAKSRGLPVPHRQRFSAELEIAA
jgi:hypothetical protein